MTDQDQDQDQDQDKIIIMTAAECQSSRSAFPPPSDG